MTFRPDPSFYPSPRLAQDAPREKLAYVAAIDPRGALGARGAEPDGLAVVDVDPARAPREVGSVRIGGIVERTGHPRTGPLTGGPQMIEVSRDGKRVYVTSSLYAAWDEQFYPDGVAGWMTKVDVSPGGGIAVDPAFYVDFGHRRPHQVRLEGGDASSDSYCYP